MTPKTTTAATKGHTSRTSWAAGRVVGRVVGAVVGIVAGLVAGAVVEVPAGAGGTTTG